MLRFWLQDSVAPRGAYAERAGRWAAEDAWPSRARSRRRRPTSRRPGWRPTPATATTLAHSSPLTLGADAGSWLPYGNPADLPGRPARRGRLVAVLRRPAAGGAARRARHPAPAPAHRGRPAGGVRRRAPLRRGARRHVRPRHPRRPQPLPPPRARPAGAARARRGRRRRAAAEGDRLRGPGRPPPAARALDVVLAVGLAVARARRGDASPATPAAASSCRCVRRAPRTPSSTPFDEPEISAPLAGRVAGGAQPALGDRARRRLGLAHDRHVARAVRRQALPERHRVPRPRPGALRHPRGRPALGDASSASARSASAAATTGRRASRCGRACRPTARTSTSRRRSTSTRATTWCARAPTRRASRATTAEPWTRAATRRRWRRGSTRSSR